MIVTVGSGVARGGGGGGGGGGGHGPPKLLVLNFPINLRCYVLLGCRVINVILAINIGDSAFFDIAALVRQFGGLRHHQQTESIHCPPPPPPPTPPQTKILATPLTVGNNINRRDDTSGARYTAANGVLFTMSWNSLCIKAIKYSYTKWLYRNVNQVCRYAANAIACMVVARSQYNRDTKMTILTRPA